MLKHEPEQTPIAPAAAQIPAAERRVSAEELTRAVSALEDAKATERIAGVAPIGQVVDELGLDSTPEEIWAEVEKQRAQKATDEQPKQTPPAVVPAAVFQTLPRRPRWWVAWVAVAVFGGIGLNAAMQRAPTMTNSGSIIISGDRQVGTDPVQDRNMTVNGARNMLTLQGNCPTLTVTGHGNYIRVEGTVRRVITDGDSNIVVYTLGPAPAISGNGKDNRVERLSP